MKYYIAYLILLSTFIFSQSCKTVKTSETEKVSQVDSNNMIKDGYTKGVIKFTKSRSCPHTITVNSYSDSLDPININDFFKENVPEKVWIKFTSLRMRNRCDLGRPIRIIDIVERLD